MKKILFNYLNLITAEVVSRILVFYAIVYFARVLGVDGFGKISFAQAMVAYVLVIINYGLDYVGMYEISKDKPSINSIISYIFSIRLIISGVSCIVLIIFVLTMNISIETKMVILVYCLIVFSSVFDINWVYQVLGEIPYIALIKLVNSLLLLVSAVSFVRTQKDLLVAAVVFPVSALVASFIGIRLYSGRNYIGFNFSLRDLKKLLIKSTPISLIMMLAATSYSLPLIFVGLYEDSASLGIYSAAFKILQVAVIPAAFWYQVFIPLLSKNELQIATYKKYILGNMVIACVIAGGLFVFSRPIIIMLYGPNYYSSILILQILCLNVITSGLIVSLASPLSLWGYQKYHLAASGLGFMALLISGPILVKNNGIIGAAAVSVIGDLVTIISIILILLKRNIIFKNQVI